MKFLVLALAAVSAASATYISPIATGYSSGLGWGHGSIATPVVTGYSAQVVTPVVRNVVAAAPAVATYNTYSAPIVSATAVTPIVRNVVAAAPAITTYASAAPVVTSYSAPAISTYSVNPIGLGHGTILDSGLGLGHDSWGLDLWKKKKAAH